MTNNKLQKIVNNHYGNIIKDIDDDFDKELSAFNKYTGIITRIFNVIR